MRNQVLSIEQMRHLKELGVDTSKASMGWTYVQSKAYPTMKTDASLIIGVDADKMMEDSEYETVLIPSFTLQDIIELLPEEIEYDFTLHYLAIKYDTNNDGFAFMYSDGHCSMQYVCEYDIICVKVTTMCTPAKHCALTRQTA